MKFYSLLILLACLSAGFSSAQTENESDDLAYNMSPQGGAANDQQGGQLPPFPECTATCKTGESCHAVCKPGQVASCSPHYSEVFKNNYGWEMKTVCFASCNCR